MPNTPEEEERDPKIDKVAKAFEMPTIGEAQELMGAAAFRKAQRSALFGADVKVTQPDAPAVDSELPEEE